MIRTIAAVLLLAPMASYAGVYKCKDEKGAMHYQDRPCSGGKKAAAFNSSARNITGIDSEAFHREAEGYLGAANAKKVEAESKRNSYDPDDDVVAIAEYQRERDRLDSLIRRSRDGGLPSSGKFRPRGETEHQSLVRARRNLEAREMARKNGTTYVPEAAPAVAPILPPIHQGPTTRFDQYGNPYTDFNNGAPLINQQTGRPCHRTGGPNVRCE